MTDNVVYASKTSQFALRGSIAVHFMDGEILEGVFATQDAFNIFVTVNDQPVMIPRQQIRYIKGLTGQGIEPDTTPDVPQDDAPTQVQVPPPAPPQIVVTQPLPVAPDVTASPSAPLPPPVPLPVDDGGEDDDEDDGTMILMPGQADTVFDMGEDDEDDDDDGTMILVPGAEPAAPALASPYDTSESMPMAAPLALAEADEELDLTFVLGEIDLPGGFDLERDEPTLALGLGLEEDKTLTAAMICINGPHSGEIFPLSAGITTIGRSSDNVIVLFKDKEISRHHAIILFESDRFVVQDQNSLNGTFVNDEQISGPRYLEHGDVVLVGVSYLKYEIS